MNTKGIIKAAPRDKEIRISLGAAPRSRYLIDARKLLQPWITVEGVAPRVLPPIIPRAPQKPITLGRTPEPKEKESRVEIVFDIFFVITHPLRWYRHFQKLQSVESARRTQKNPVVSAPRVVPEPQPPPLPRAAKSVWPSMRIARISFPKINTTHRAAFSFGMMSMVLLFPLHSLGTLSIFDNKAKLESQAAALQKQLAAGGAPASLTPSLFELAATFQETEKQLGIGKEIIHLAASLPVPLGSLQSNAALFEAGEAVANAITTISRALTETPSDATTAEKAHALLDTATSLQPDIEQIKNSLLRIDADHVPSAARPHVVPLQKLLTAVNTDLKTITENTRALLALLGTDYEKRFLVLFQNDAELRATGGFIGSFGILDIADGSIKKFEIPETGSYAVQGQLTAYLRAPEPFYTVNTRLEFQDSNWFPDFPTSAETAMRLYELAHGATVDGVIAINTRVLEGLLEVLGPIQNPGTGTLLDAKTIVADIQKDIEKNKAAGQAPKQMLGLLAPVIMEQFKHLSPAQSLQLVQVFNNARNQKDMLMYAKDPEVEATLHDLSWDGAIDRESKEDSVMVINSNIGGGKSDALMQQKIIQHLTIAPDGRTTKKLSIVRTHTGTEKDSVINRNYLRVYVPEGATLISGRGFDQPPEALFHAPEIWYDEHPLIKAAEETAHYDAKSGIKIYNEFGKTVFASWVLTAPGRTSIVELEYELPRRAFDPAAFRSGILGKTPSFSYTVNAVKQPGDPGSELLTSITLPDGWEPVWLAPNNIEIGHGTLIHRTTLKEDRLIGFVAARK